MLLSNTLAHAVAARDANTSSNSEASIQTVTLKHDAQLKLLGYVVSMLLVTAHFALVRLLGVYVEQCSNPIVDENIMLHYTAVATCAHHAVKPVNCCHCQQLRQVCTVTTKGTKHN
eukprot:2911-Heterococcus_DN1.PRE.1